jgi:hypothetical protein
MFPVPFGPTPTLRNASLPDRGVGLFEDRIPEYIPSLALKYKRRLLLPLIAEERSLFSLFRRSLILALSLMKFR